LLQQGPDCRRVLLLHRVDKVDVAGASRSGNSDACGAGQEDRGAALELV
jgi:hypothetical protein